MLITPNILIKKLENYNINEENMTHNILTENLMKSLTEIPCIDVYLITFSLSKLEVINNFINIYVKYIPQLEDNITDLSKIIIDAIRNWEIKNGNTRLKVSVSVKDIKTANNNLGVPDVTTNLIKSKIKK